MHARPQADHCDLGLIEDDNTPDMRTPLAATRGSFSKPNHPTPTKEKF